MTMAGRIDKQGRLYIQRVNEEVEQQCPFSSSNFFPCGDHCPFFKELDNIYDGEHGNRGNLKSRRISVCDRIIEINKDERE